MRRKTCGGMGKDSRVGLAAGHWEALPRCTSPLESVATACSIGSSGCRQRRSRAMGAEKASYGSPLGYVTELRDDDIEDVAALHQLAFLNSSLPASRGRSSYYRHVFLENPRADAELPSLIYRNDDGKIMGFLGCVPRVMHHPSGPKKVAVVHRVMASKDADTPHPGQRLIAELLSGPQDLTLCDGANDRGHRAFRRAGLSTVHSYSLEWLRPLRPASFAATVILRRSRLLAGALKPLVPLADLLLRHVLSPPRRDVAGPPPRDGADADTVLRLLRAVPDDYTLRPLPDPEWVAWLVDFLVRNRFRGVLKGFSVPGSNRNELRGGALYYLRPTGVAEFLLIVAGTEHRRSVFDLALRHAYDNGAGSAKGRLDPRYLDVLSETGCFLRPGNWCSIHSPDPQLAAEVHRGDAFISAVDGELWLGGPLDPL